eukprot:3461692-Amphidinium_carterae.1
MSFSNLCGSFLSRMHEALFQSDGRHAFLTSLTFALHELFDTRPLALTVITSSLWHVLSDDSMVLRCCRLLDQIIGH